MLNSDLFIKGETIAVALSGGKDSVCLFDLLLSKSEEFGITVKAINVDHGIRGETSGRDSLFVKNLCEEKGIPLFFSQSRLSRIFRGKRLVGGGGRARVKI